MIIEACVENINEAQKSQDLGATRIELCDNLHVGGTTPSYGVIKHCVENLKIPSFVMIRPRGGNFVYNQNEINVMLEDIKICQQLQVAGVVFGCLNSDDSINYNQMEMLCKAAQGLSIVLHKAYDEVTNPWLEIAKLSSIGVNHILSSGAAKSIFDGKDHLLKTFEEASKHNIKLTACGGVSSENLKQAQTEVAHHDLHGKLIVGKL